MTIHENSFYQGATMYIMGPIFLSAVGSLIKNLDYLLVSFFSLLLSLPLHLTWSRNISVVVEINPNIINGLTELCIPPLSLILSPY